MDPSSSWTLTAFTIAAPGSQSSQLLTPGYVTSKATTPLQLPVLRLTCTVSSNAVSSTIGTSAFLHCLPCRYACTQMGLPTNFYSPQSLQQLARTPLVSPVTGSFSCLNHRHTYEYLVPRELSYSLARLTWYLLKQWLVYTHSLPLLATQTHRLSLACGFTPVTGI